MNRLEQPQKFSRWFFLLLALGLHGVVLSLPIDTQKPDEKPRMIAVKLAPSPRQSTFPVAMTKPRPLTSPVAATPTPQRSTPTIVKASPVATPQVSARLKPTPKPTPDPVQPTPTPGPDAFQVKGAIACEGIKDCYASAETNGRQISKTLEQQLQAQGYTLEPLELNEDTGMQVYRLFQNGQPKDYLHIIWTDQGTRSLRLPDAVKNRQALAAVAQLAPQDL